jgi:serine/threonine protein kinase
VKLADFGVSSVFQGDKRKISISLKELGRSTSRGIISKTEGTFPFYSPEMCSASATGYSAYMADTWAASVCLWIFIFGELPFRHHDVTELFSMIR